MKRLHHTDKPGSAVNASLHTGLTAAMLANDDWTYSLATPTTALHQPIDGRTAVV